MKSRLPAVSIVGADHSLEYYLTYLKETGFVVKNLFDYSVNKNIVETFRRHDIKIFYDNFDSFIMNCDSNLIFLMGSSEKFIYFGKKIIGLGKHVIFTNTIGTVLTECDEVGIFESIQKLFVKIVNPLRYVYAFQLAKAHFDRGSLGRQILLLECNVETSTLIKNTYEDWLYDRSTGGGLLYQVISHYIDMFGYVFNLKCSSVMANLNTLKPHPYPTNKFLTVDADDCVCLNLKFENSTAIGIINSNSLEVEECYHHKIKIITNTHKIEIIDSEFKMTQLYSDLEAADDTILFLQENKYSLESSLTNHSSDAERLNIDYQTCFRNILCDEDLQANITVYDENIFKDGIQRFVKSLKNVFIDELNIDLNKASSGFQSFSQGLFVKVFIDAAIESHSRATWISLSEISYRLECDVKYIFQKQEMMYHLYENSITMQRKNESSGSKPRGKSLHNTES